MASNGETLTDVPEIFETVLGESLVARTEGLPSFRLGPPDLVHILKKAAKPNLKDATTYHFVLGVETSSPGSLAAYINTLTYSLPSPNSGWFASKPLYRIKSGVYCSFNAFSKVDVRVEVRIPGGVECYAVSRSGKRIPSSQFGPLFWSELFVSSCVRAILEGSQPSSPAGLRLFDALPNLDTEKRFLAACVEVFHIGCQIGPKPGTQIASNVSNRLTHALVKYFGEESGRWNVLVKFWEEVLSRDPDVAAPLAQAYIGIDQEMKAVKLLYESLTSNSLSVPLLEAQVDYLRSKGQSRYALIIAKRLVIGAPLEFHSWARLTKCYMDLKEWKMSLLTLNSCPMFVSPAKDFHNMPPPARFHFPFPDEELMLQLSESEQTMVAPVSRAEGLRGTARLAYELLIEIVNKAGWEELLGHRAQVFVMEEEYQKLRDGNEKESEPGVTNQESSDLKAPEEDKASVELPPEKQGTSPRDGPNEDDPTEPGKAASDHDQPTALEMKPDPGLQELSDGDPSNSGDNDDAGGGQAGAEEEQFDEVDLSPASKPGGSDVQESDDENPTAQPDQLDVQGEARGGKEKDESQVMKWVRDAAAEGRPLPLQDKEQGGTIPGADSVENDAGSSTDSPLGGPKLASAFSHKRLCERWLDDLFIIVYEDLRVFAAWQAEETHAKRHSTSYRRSHSELEYLGELAKRLRKKANSRDAFQSALAQKYTVRVSLRLLELVAEDAQESPEAVIGAISRLLSVQGGPASINMLNKVYGQMLFPSPIANALMRTIRRHGLQHVQTVTLNMQLSAEQYREITKYLEYCETFRVGGSDW